MSFSRAEKLLQEESIEYLHKHTEELIYQFIVRRNPIKLAFISIFMAGSPGAGKTEFSQRYLPIMSDLIGKTMRSELDILGFTTSSYSSLIVRIDVDEIREFFPQYHKSDLTKGIKGNAELIQKAANIALNLIRNYCLSNNISFLHDGTFSNYETMKDLIRRSLKQERKIVIFYLYLDPYVAWGFTKAREIVEGRNILKDKFILQYLNSPINIERAKRDFGNRISVNLIVKDKSHNIIMSQTNIESIHESLSNLQAAGILKLYSKQELLNNLN